MGPGGAPSYPSSQPGPSLTALIHHRQTHRLFLSFTILITYDILLRAIPGGAILPAAKMFNVFRISPRRRNWIITTWDVCVLIAVSICTGNKYIQYTIA